MNASTALPISNETRDKERLSSAVDARQLISILLQGGTGRAKANASFKGCYDGNPPFNAAKMKANGQSNLINVNFLGFKANVSAGLVPYYDLFAGAKYYCEVETDYGQTNDRKEWSEIITDELDRLLHDWPGFDYNINTAMFDRLVYGKGFCVHNDRDDWRFQHVYQGRIFVPDGQEASIERLETLVIRQPMRVSKLYGFIRDRKIATDAGWNVDAVMRAIKSATIISPFTNESTWNNAEAVQQWLRDKDVLEGARQSTVQCSHVYQKEWDGQISHYIVTETPQEKEPKEGGYLFNQAGQFKSFAECIWPTFFETNDGSWNGASGLGRDIFSQSELQNRLIGASADAAFIRAGISIQAKSERARQNTNMVQIGRFNIIPPEYEVQQSTVLGDINGPMQVERFLEQITSSNTGIYRQKLDQQTGNPRTAEEVRLQYQASAVLGNSAVNRFYSDLDRLYKDVYRRVSNPNTKDKEALTFQKRCEKRGVPKLALMKPAFVKAYRNMGNGSMFLRQQSIAGMLPFVQMFNEEGRGNFLDDAISVTTSQRNVERWNPRTNQRNVEDQMAMALLENNSLKNNNPVMVTGTQNHVVHSGVHLDSAEQSLSALDSGANPMEIAAFIDNAGKHVAQHLQEIGPDTTRSKEAQSIKERLTQLGKVHDQLVQGIEQMQAQQQEQQATQQQAAAMRNGTDPEIQIKAAQAESDARLKKLKNKHQMDLKDASTRQKLAINDALAAAELRLKQQAHEFDMKLKSTESSATTGKRYSINKVQ